MQLTQRRLQMYGFETWHREWFSQQSKAIPSGCRYCILIEQDCGGIYIIFFPSEDYFPLSFATRDEAESFLKDESFSPKDEPRFAPLQ